MQVIYVRHTLPLIFWKVGSDLFVNFPTDPFFGLLGQEKKKRKRPTKMSSLNI
jgi:hypothetical protein